MPMSQAGQWAHAFDLVELKRYGRSYMIHEASRRSPRATVPPPACLLPAMPSQWTDLPLDILRLVADRLPATADYLRLMSVTPSWCSALQKPDAVAQRLRWAGVSEGTIDAMSPSNRLKRLSRLGLVEDNLDHGRYQMRAFHTHETNFYVATFSHDKTRVLTFSEDYTPQVWTVAQPDRPLLLRGQTSEPTSAAFSHDDTRVAIATYGGTVRVWTLAQLDTPLVLQTHDECWRAIAFSQDGTRLMVASYRNRSGIVLVWTLEEPSSPLALRGHTDSISSAAFSHDDTCLATSSHDGTAQVWTLAQPDRPLVLRGHRSGLFSAAFSHDDTRVVTASYDGTARVWTLAQPDSPIVLRGHWCSVQSAVFSHDDTRVVTSSCDDTAFVWCLSQPDRPVVLRGHTDWVYSAAFSHDDTRVVTGSYDNTARVWTLAQPDSPLVLTHARQVSRATFSYDDTCVLTASNGDTARLYDFAVSIPRTGKTDTCSQQNQTIELKKRPFGLRSLSPQWFLRFATHLQNSKLFAALPLHGRKRISKPIARLSTKTTG
jgi:WD40 repeat protein